MQQDTKRTLPMKTKIATYLMIITGMIFLGKVISLNFYSASFFPFKYLNAAFILGLILGLLILFRKNRWDWFIALFLYFVGLATSVMKITSYSDFYFIQPVIALLIIFLLLLDGKNFFKAAS
jgi:hypothetical protein